MSDSAESTHELAEPSPEPVPAAGAGGGGTATAVRTATSDLPSAPPRRRRRRPNWLGLVVAVTTFGWALTPSLLPRPWIFEGVIAGLGAALGYGVGCLVSWLVRRTPIREPRPAVKLWAWRVLVVGGTVVVVAYLLAGTYWQNGVRQAVGFPDEGYGWAVVVGLVAGITAVLTVLVARQVRRFNAWIGRGIDRFLPAPLAWALAVVVVVVLAWLLVTDVLFRGFTTLMTNVYDGTNATTAPGISQPLVPQRSGSPPSLVAWDTLGMEGRNFVARGPRPGDLQAFSGRPAKEPVRVYVGLDSAPTATERAALAVKELERTGAFDRGVLVVVGTTGTGWIEPQSADSFEYAWNGDSAIVGIQYSFLPSWISTLVDVDKAADAGTELFAAVHAAWEQRPAASRPKLIAYGLSLGSYSMQSGFSSADDLAQRTQGAIFVGTPSFSEPWGSITAAREPGSPQWKPVYAAGRTVRFAGKPSDYAQPPGAWATPRVGYLQHANDSVVWWSADLLFSEPDWLREPPGPGRSADMHWYPVITFLQVTVDQFMGVSVPDGQGHNYGGSMPAVIVTVTDPPQWTAEQTVRLTELVMAMPIE